MSPKIAPSRGEVWTQSYKRFLGPTPLTNPNGISIASSIFAGVAAHSYPLRQLPRGKN